MTIRQATVAEAGRLSALAFAAKASWGYDATFMVQCRDELTVTPAYIRSHPVRVAFEADAVLGFQALADLSPSGEGVLDSLFVDPAAQGQGVGRALFQDAVQVARDLGAEVLVIEADPYAEGFYRAMGADPDGTVPSGSIPGRLLPRLVVRLKSA